MMIKLKLERQQREHGCVLLQDGHDDQKRAGARTMKPSILSTVAAAAIALTVAMPAKAAELPRYDSAHYCAAIAGVLAP